MKNDNLQERSNPFRQLINRFMGLFALCAMLAMPLSSCHNNDLWDEMPGEISEFISDYFPGTGINAFTHTADSYHVRVSDGPGITFDKNYHWVSIAGYGLPLPQVLLFDQLPPKLYNYLESTQQLNSVFSLERNSKRYTVTLQLSTITYDIATGEIEGVRPAS